MKSKEEIIRILKLAFPDKRQYMYEFVAEYIVSDIPLDTISIPYKYFSYSDYIAKNIQNVIAPPITLPPITSTERVPVKEFESIVPKEFEFDATRLQENSKKTYKEFAIASPNFDGSKDPSISNGLRGSVVHYDEDAFYNEDVYKALNSLKYSDPNIAEYGKAINDICYEIFNKYVTISKAGDVLDGNFKPLDKKQEKILRDAVEALSPLVDGYCPWCSWMMILREIIKILDGRK